MSAHQAIATEDTLLRRPEARAFKIEDLLADLRQGRVRIPQFQRKIKWQREDALHLLDSIYRGYPIGTLLIWETKAEADEVRFGALTVSAPGRSDAFWIVDGQQRLVSLARMLLAPQPNIDDFAAFFDLDTAKFVARPSPSKLDSDVSRWLPLTEILDSERLLQWLFSNAAASRERRDKATQLGKRIREYDVPVYILRTDDEAALRDIFKRVNSAGKPMEEYEVFEALNGSRATAKPSTIGQIRASLDELEFGGVEEKILYKLLRVLQGEDVTDRAGRGPSHLSPEQAEMAYRDTAAAARAVVLFLKNDVGIPHNALLPYKQPLVTLGKFFNHHPAPTSRSRELLVRWLWRGALDGSHRGDTVSTRAALDRIKANDEVGSVQRLLNMVSSSPVALPDVEDKFSFRFAAGKLLMLAMLDLTPVDLESCAPLSIAALLDDGQGEHDLPFVQVISSAPGHHGRLLQSAANRLIQPVRPGVRKTLLKISDGAALASHGINIEALKILSVGQSMQFLEMRAAILRPLLSRFFERQARWQETDRPPLAALVVEDEEP